MALKELYANNATTTLAGTSQPWASTPAAGTSESWQVTSTGGKFPVPVSGFSHMRLVVYAAAGDTDPEILDCTAINDATHFQVIRGAESSTVKVHAAGDIIAQEITNANLISLSRSPASRMALRQMAR